MATSWRKHDAGFFTLEFPSEWVLQEPAPATVVLQESRGELTVKIAAFSKRPATGRIFTPTRPVMSGEAQQELQKWLRSQGQVSVRQGPRIMANGRYAAASAQGIERPQMRAPWYVRLWRRRPRIVWRFWAILNTHILVLASCSGKPEVVEKHRATVDRVLASLRLSEKEILLGRPFTDKVISLARSYFPELSVAIIDEDHLSCGSQPISLAPLQRRYLAAPEDLPTHVKSFFSEMQGEQSSSRDGSAWRAARPRLLPNFVPAAQASAQDLAEEPWINGLSITYLIEEESQAERPVTSGDLRRWNADPEVLHQQALRNLVLHSHEHTMEVHKAPGYTLLLLVSPDKYNAVRLLLPELHSILREHLGATFYAAIPAREFLLAFSAPSDEVLMRVRQQVSADYARAKNPVSPKLFLVTPDGIAGDPMEAEDLEL